MTEPLQCRRQPRDHGWRCQDSHRARPTKLKDKSSPKPVHGGYFFQSIFGSQQFSGCAVCRQNVLSRSQQITDFLFASDSPIEQDFLILVSLIDFAEQNDELHP
jgi:hypothetical protein